MIRVAAIVTTENCQEDTRDGRHYILRVGTGIQNGQVKKKETLSQRFSKIFKHSQLRPRNDSLLQNTAFVIFFHISD